MHRHNGTDYQHANDCPHCWREASDIQSEAINRLSAQLAEKGRECERLRANIEAALGIAEKAEADTRDRPWRAIHAIFRALENDDG